MLYSSIYHCIVLIISYAKALSGFACQDWFPTLSGGVKKSMRTFWCYQY